MKPASRQLGFARWRAQRNGQTADRHEPIDEGLHALNLEEGLHAAITAQESPLGRLEGDWTDPFERVRCATLGCNNLLVTDSLAGQCRNCMENAQ